MKRTLSSQSSGTSLMFLPVRPFGMSAAVTTASTPGMASAREASMETMRAWGNGLRTFFAQTVPGGTTSAV